MSGPGRRADPVRLLRVIARLNVGGPSIQAITLTKRLEPLGYTTTLVRGQEGPREGDMDYLADDLGVTPVRVPALQRDPGWHDVRALFALVRIIRRDRPRIVHTHAAKAGALGRLATLLAFPRQRKRPALVHTFHGHSLSGYFAPRTAAVFRAIERLLARFSDSLIAVSDEVRDDLVALGVADASRFEVIPLGFDLGLFSVSEDERARAREALRTELGISHAATVVTLIARLVPIKRVDRFLHAAVMLRHVPDVHFLIVGDGELNDRLRSSPEAVELGGCLTWAGFRRDIPTVCFASDIVVLCSDNEGTPVSLIEASAAGVPTVSTKVGGAPRVVRDGETGRLVACDSGEDLARAVGEMLANDALRESMAEEARTHAFRAFSLERLISDLDDLYQRLLAPS